MARTIPPPKFLHLLLRARNWQDRPEFGTVCNWWLSGQNGVCALVGMGGAGKTAISDRFLQVLPGGLGVVAGVAKNLALPAPERLFVFSFYRSPSADDFVQHLTLYLVGGRPQAPSQQDLPTLITERTGRFLLVLDGLERIQRDPFSGGPAGRLEDRRLAELMEMAADGYLPGVQFLVTSRLPIADLAIKRTTGYREIAVEKLSEAAAVSLLRERGIKGSDAQLRAVAQESGFHALTLDLLASYASVFCDGDPSRLPRLSEVAVAPKDDLSSATVGAHQEQSRRFGLLVASYLNTLSSRDPQTLAILQLVCLSRLGMTPSALLAMLAKLRKKELLPELQNLDRHQLRQKLSTLCNLRLLEGPKGRSLARFEDDVPLSAHPAIRDSFSKELSLDTAREAHKAAQETLRVSLGDVPTASRSPSDAAILDVVEEMVYHSVHADAPWNARDIYWNDMGNFQNLGWRLGAYERGARICKELLAAFAKDETSWGPQFSGYNTSRIRNEYALYQIHQGSLPEAIETLREAVPSRLRNPLLGKATLSYRNFVSARLLAGYLHAYEFYGILAVEANTLKGEIQKAMRDLKAVYSAERRSHRGYVAFLRKIFFRGLGPVGATGLVQAKLFCRIGRIRNAVSIVRNNRSFLAAWPQHYLAPRFNLVLADIMLAKGDVAKARELQQEAQDWSSARGAAEIRCWSYLISAKAHVLEALQHKSTGRAAALLDARRDVEAGLRIARASGYGIYHIDLLLERARLSLLSAAPQPALCDLRVALDDGYTPPPNSGSPALLAATHPQCGYAWGIAAGLHLQAQALLLQAAQALGRSHFDAGSLDNLPSGPRSLVESARNGLSKCVKLRKRIQDPKLRESEELLHKLDGHGVLTTFPLSMPAETDKQATDPKTSMTTTISRDQVFISYSHEDSKFLRELIDHLKPLERAGKVKAWSDEQISPGSKWFEEIGAALARTKVAVMLVTRNFLASDFINDQELGPLLKEAENGGVRILWVPVRACNYKETPLKDYQSAISPDKPLAPMGAGRDAAWVKVCEEIIRALNA